jgi:hypothetical protein
MRWVVVLEAAAPTASIVVDLDAVEELAAIIGDPDVIALYSPDRYALQFEVEAPTPGAALEAGERRWRQAVSSLQALSWPLVRVEVLPPEELEAVDADALTDLPMFLRTGDEVPAAVLEATRGILRARTAGQIVQLLIRLVHRLGGHVRSPEDAGPDAVPVDLSFGLRPPLVPVAERLSLARLRLEEVLPGVVDDARTAIERLDELAVRPAAPV